MKLSDIIIENKKVINESGTSNSDLPRFNLTATTRQDVMLMWIKDAQGNYDRYIKFEGEDGIRQAQALQRRWNANPDRFDGNDGWLRQNSDRVKTGVLPRSQGRLKTADALIDAVKGNAARRAPILAAIVNSNMFRIFTRMLGQVGLSGAAFYGVLGAIYDVETDPNLSQEEKDERINILWGQLSIQLLLIWSRIARNVTMVQKALSYIKNIIRAGQLAAAGSVVGAIPALISMIVTEASWLLISAALASPAVQRAFAEYMTQYTLGAWIGAIGSVAGPALSTAGRILDSVLPDSITGPIKELFGFDSEQKRGGREGEMYASTEWAKLTFSHLLFPDAMDPTLVPYISPARREDLMFEVLGITQQSTVPNETPQQPTQEPDQEIQLTPAAGV